MPHNITLQWDSLTANEWENALATLPYTAYQQHYAYGETLLLAGRKTTRAALYKGNSLIGLAQYGLRKFGRYFTLATTLRGPIWLCELTDAEKQICYQLLRKTRPFKRFGVCIYMPETNDNAALKACGAKRVMSGHSTICIDLTKDEATLRADMDGKWRNRLKNAENRDIHVSKIGKKLEQYGWILEKEAAQASMVGYKALPAAFVPLFQLASSKPALFGLRAEYNQETIGGVLLLLHGNTATYHIGWSNETGKKLGAHNLLLWQSIQELKQKNFQSLDLGGVSTDAASSGLARFKLGLSGNVISLNGSFI